MIDLKAVRVTGALNISRARVLWQDGVMKFYGKEGLIDVIVNAEKPIKKSGWWRVWLSHTPRGVVHLSSRCSTCGGWSKVTRLPPALAWLGIYV